MEWFVDSEMIAGPESRVEGRDGSPTGENPPAEWRSRLARQGTEGIATETAVPAPQERSNGAKRQAVVLVPFDATAESLATAKTGVRLAQHTGARLVLFHAVHLNLTPYGPANPTWIKAALRQEAVEFAEPVMRYAQALGVSVICAVEEGAPTDTILKAAKKWRADLIMLAAQQRNRLARWFERRALDRVIRAAECPVLVLDAKRGRG